MEWLNDAAPAMKVLVSMLTFVATALLLYLNYKANRIARASIDELELTYMEENRPRVVFYMEVTHGSHLDLVLCNVGRSAATNLKVQVDQNFKVWNSLISDDEYTIQDMTIVGELDMLAPGDEFREWVDFPFKFFPNLGEDDNAITGKVTYEDAIGQPFEFPIDINLDVYKHLATYQDKSLSDLKRALEQITRHLTGK